jgi:hypothetical protein
VNVASVSAGVTTGGAVSADILYDNHAAYEWNMAGLGRFTLIDVNVVSLDGSQANADSMYLAYDTTALFEHTNRGFAYLDFNVQSALTD